MDERERARRQQVAETKRRQRKFEERAKAREMAEADMVRPATRACTSRLRPGARFANPETTTNRILLGASVSPSPRAPQAKRVLQERKAKREAATRAIHEPSATPSPGVPGARFGALRKGTGVAGAFGRKGLPTRVDGGDGAETRERPATTAFGSRVRPSRPRDWSARAGNDLPNMPSRRPSWSASSRGGDDEASESAWSSRPSSRRSSKSAFTPFERERPGDAAHRIRAFLNDRNVSGARPAGFAGSKADASPAAPWRLLKANAAADLGAMLGELDPDPEKDPSSSARRNGEEAGSISIDHSLLEVPEDPEEKYEREAKAAAARAAAAEAKARAEATKAKRDSRPTLAARADGTASDPLDRGGRLSSSSRDFKAGSLRAGTRNPVSPLRRPSSPVEDSAQPSPTTAHEDDDAVRTVRDSLELDDDGAAEPRRSVLRARVWREGDDVSGEDSDSEDEAPTLAEARAAMAAAERGGDGRLSSASTKDAVNLNLFRDSLAELPAGATTSAAVAELVSSVNGVLDSIDTFRAIERGVDEHERDDDRETFEGRRIADMRTGKFRMQADETGIVPEFYGAPEASGTRETSPTPPPPSSERETVEPEAYRVPPETRHAAASAAPETPETLGTTASSTRIAEAVPAFVPAAPIPARSSPPPGNIPVATPIAVTREGAMRLVRAGIPLPDAYKAVLGEAPPRRAPEAVPAAAAIPAAAAAPSAGGYFPVPRSARPAPPPATPPTASPAVGGYAQKLEPRPASEKKTSARRRASPTVSERKGEKARAVAERELKLEGSYAVAADEAASRRRREARRLAAIEAEAREARAEEAAAAAAAARRARADSARDRHNTVFAPPPFGDRRGARRRDDAKTFFEPSPPPSTTPRALGAKTVTPHGRRQTRVRFAETPEGRAARELLGDEERGTNRAPLGERFVNRMLAAGGRAPTSLSTEEAKLLASIRRLDARRGEGDPEAFGTFSDLDGGDAFASRRSVEEAALLASLARLNGELVSPSSGGTFEGDGKSVFPVARQRRDDGFSGSDRFLDVARPNDFPTKKIGRLDQRPSRGDSPPPRYVSPAEFPAGVKPRPHRKAREPNRVPQRRWTPPDRDAGPVLDEWGAPPPRVETSPAGHAPRRGVSAAPLVKKRMNVGYVPPNARSASARRGTHVRDSGGVISGRITDYF